RVRPRPSPRPCVNTLSLHDALPIWPQGRQRRPGRLPVVLLQEAAVRGRGRHGAELRRGDRQEGAPAALARNEREHLGPPPRLWRSEEHTSELQSRSDLVCRLLLEKK